MTRLRMQLCTPKLIYYIKTKSKADSIYIERELEGRIKNRNKNKLYKE